MARDATGLVSPEVLGLASFGFAALAGVYFVFRSRRRKRPTPEQIEAHRREWLSRNGKLGGGEILEILEDSISYIYDVRGVNYTSWQDVSALRGYLPNEPWSIVGGVGVRYDPRNPANSIIVSERWSGLRKQHPKPS